MNLQSRHPRTGWRKTHRKRWEEQRPERARRPAHPQKRATPRERWGTAWDDIPVDNVRGPLPRRPMRNEAPTLFNVFAGTFLSLWPVSGLTTHRSRLPTRDAQWHTRMFSFEHTVRTDLHGECGRLPLRGQRRFARSGERRALLPV